MVPIYEYRPTGDLFEIRFVIDKLMIFSRKFGIRYLDHEDIVLFRPAKTSGE